MGERGRFTALRPDQVALVREIGSDPLALCKAVQGLVVHPMFASASLAASPDRLAEQDVRPAAALLDRIVALSPSPLASPRPEETRVVGTCRHFAVLGAAFLQAAGVEARARCGFVGGFTPGKWADHWIAEWRSADGWVRTDVQWMGLDAPFLAAGEAWQAFRRGEFDGHDFGVAGTENWGPGEIRANVMRDLAALEGVEVLPWDMWGPMEDSYDGRTDDEFDRLVDEMAAASGSSSAERQRLLAALGPMDLD